VSDLPHGEIRKFWVAAGGHINDYGASIDENHLYEFVRILVRTAAIETIAAMNVRAEASRMRRPGTDRKP
jgi:hypothetical protein